MTGTQADTTPALAAAVRRVTEETRRELRGRIRPWLQTRQGAASVALGGIVFLIAWGPLDIPFVPAGLIAALAIIGMSLVADLWERRTTPAPPPFCRLAESADDAVEVERDDNAGFWRDSRGFLWGGRVWFVGTGCPPLRIRPETHAHLRRWHDRNDLPVFVARSGDRQWWWWRNAFYWESGDSEPEDVSALIVALEAKEHEEQVLEDGESLFLDLEMEREVYLAAPISGEMRRLVFERDGGRCVGCGSSELIQYHHVVPFWKGGDNDPENLELLCAGCNRGHALASVDSTM